MAKWCIDFGHGGNDSGAVNGKRYEKNDVKTIGDKLVKLLEYNGESVIVTRKKDEYLTLTERCNIANNNKVDYLVSLHRNSSPNALANGLETFSCVGATKGKQLARKVQDSLIEKIPFRDRGIKEAKFTVIYKTKMPSILIELGFISNTKDNQLFDENIEIITQQVARGCLAYVGKTLKVPTTAKPTETSKTVKYRVVCGSFTNKGNAEKRLADIKEKTGYSCFLLFEEVNGKRYYRVICGSFADKGNAEKRLEEVKLKTGYGCFINPIPS